MIFQKPLVRELSWVGIIGIDVNRLTSWVGHTTKLLVTGLTREFVGSCNCSIVLPEHAKVAVVPKGCRLDVTCEENEAFAFIVFTATAQRLLGKELVPDPPDNDPEVVFAREWAAKRTTFEYPKKTADGD